MQKLGLDSLQEGKTTSLEAEIAKEKASALGLAGAKLQRSLLRYKATLQAGCLPAQQDDLISEIADNVSALLVQRELGGLVHDNVLWVLEVHDIPDAVLSKLGLTKGV